MEHDEKPLPIDTRLLGALAEKVSSIIAVFVSSANFGDLHDRVVFLLKLLNYLFSVEHMQKPSIIKKWSLKLFVPRRWVQIPLRWLNPLFILTINYTSMRFVLVSHERTTELSL
jgi:hypothetical protein